jgi:hypothetical protein
MDQAVQSLTLQQKTVDVARCQLHVALDRILWKGDSPSVSWSPERTFGTLSRPPGDQAVAQHSLAARDTTDQWLMTFGVVTSDQTNLTRLESSPDRFGIPWSDACRGSKSSTDVQYCVNGSVIADDAGYWVTTSDHIANDTAIYTMLEAK